MTSLFRNFSLSVVLGVALGFALVAAVTYAFTSPAQAPPGGNTAAPLNTSLADQTKTGGMLTVFDLWVSSALGVTGGATFGTPVGIGTTSPNYELEVIGTIRASEGTQVYSCPNASSPPSPSSDGCYTTCVGQLSFTSFCTYYFGPGCAQSASPACSAAGYLIED